MVSRFQSGLRVAHMADVGGPGLQEMVRAMAAVGQGVFLDMGA